LSWRNITTAGPLVNIKKNKNTKKIKARKETNDPEKNRDPTETTEGPRKTTNNMFYYRRERSCLNTRHLNPRIKRKD
jgi:hypothetical protein